MFWRKKSGEGKAKPLSPREVMIKKIEALIPGQAVSYSLPETFGGGLAVVTPNPTYPNKGRKYLLCTETLTDGKPSGKRRTLWESDKPMELAKWIQERLGQPFAG